METSTRRLTFISLFATLAFSLSGCLTSSNFLMARYDDAKDEFVIMNLSEQIAADTPGDAKYLYNLWLNRDSLIRMPIIYLAFARLSSNKYASISLLRAPNELDAKPTDISLDKIRVMPGKFFLRGPDTLCYYDQIVIPGTVVDEALAWFLKDLASQLPESIDNELKRRREGGRRADWPKYRAEALRHVQAVMDASPEDPEPALPAPAPGELNLSDPLQLLDDQSLQLLRRGATDGGIKFSREKELFRFVFPMSDADAHQYDQLWRAGDDAIRAAEKKNGGKVSPSAADEAIIFSALSLVPRSHAIEVRVDLSILLKYLLGLSNLSNPRQPLEDPKPERLTAMRAAIAELTAHGVAIDANITVEQLAKDFMEGTLKTYPSEKPVEPGSGLVQAGSDVVPLEKANGHPSQKN